MKSTVWILTILLASVTPSLGQKDFFAERWSRIYKYEAKSLTRSAIPVVDSIYADAKKQNNIVQLTKALMYQSKFALLLQEDAELKIVRTFKTEIRLAKSPLKNVLESVLANIYWQYFQDNRWKYYQRTAAREQVSDDFRTWDAEAIFREIHRHFQNSLKDATITGNVSLVSLNEILAQAENSKLYRPTLYDFLANNALDFYRGSESMITRPAETVILADPRYFSEFENIRLEHSDTLATELHALAIYRDLLHFHRERKDTTAYLDVEIGRLQFLVDAGTFDNVPLLWKNSLAQLRERFQKHPSSTLVDFKLAGILDAEGEGYAREPSQENQFKKREALSICEQALARFPRSEGAVRCKSLKENILAPNLDIQIEEYTPVGLPSRLLVTYKNIDTLTFSLIPVTASDDHLEELNDSSRLAILSQMPSDTTWAVVMKNLQDYQNHKTEVAIPGLPAGKYIVLFTARDKNLSSAPAFAYSEFQATDLALLENELVNGKRFQVLNRNNGRPVEGAEVHLKSEKHNPDRGFIDQRFFTDKDGFVEVKDVRSYIYNVSAYVNHENDKPVFKGYQLYESGRRVYRDDDDEFTEGKTFIFTDRSIYRPGQTVFFKGILIKTKDEKSTVVPGQYVEVFLEDPNSDEVATVRLKSNAYGSFSGEFRLPTTGITGNYSIYADEDYEDDSRFYHNLDNFYYDAAYISVEEYKRPAFETSFDPVKETFRLNDTITVHGNALAFSGSKIQGAKVKYRVKRTVRFPGWYYWYYHRRTSYTEREITFGETVTDKNGEFVIRFAAIPDESVSHDDLPVFHYEVTADVTDVNGETRGAVATVKAGYHSLIATIVAPEVINKKISNHTISISAENLNGQPVPAMGTITVFKVAAPALPQRERPWPAPDLPMMSEREFEQLFPHDAFTSEANPAQWKKSKEVFHTTFNTAVSGELSFAANPAWEDGGYIMELQTKDAFGQEVKTMHRFKLMDPQSKLVPDNELLIFETDKPSYRVGETVHLRIGSASEDLTVTVSIERNHRIVKTSTYHLEKKFREVLIPVTENMDDGFAIHCSTTAYNSFLYKQLLVQVATETEEIEIETLTFKDKLQPGSRETWSFGIKGSDALKKEVEVLASMYDASLDQFKPHAWSFNPVYRERYYSYYQVNGSESFNTLNFYVGSLNRFLLPVYPQNYDQLDWFGFSITNNYYVLNEYRSRLYTSESFDNTPKVSMSSSKTVKKGFISGTIMAFDGQPIAGVNVIVKGTMNGTATDMKGQYTIAANKGDVLVVSFIGYTTAEVEVGRKNIIDVAMEEEVMQLSEIVITGYGEMAKKNMTGSISYVVTDTVASDFMLAAPMAGRVAGVQITGLPGGDARLAIRGFTSVNGKEPLYVVDGVVVESVKIDQADLAGANILKGDAATSIYGARAANGVIIITTKSGQKKLDEAMAKVNARKNLNETAFFFPHLSTDENGKIRFTFTTPESLTRWKLQLLAHNKNLQVATKTLQAITQKELMVTPNPPRFLRVEDEIIFSAKIANLTSRKKEGKVSLQLTNAMTGEVIDAAFNNILKHQTFHVDGKGTAEVSWTLKVPGNVDAMQYRIVAKAGNFSDGEQNAIPVLSNRMLVTESMPMMVRAGETKTFSLDKLKTASSSTLSHHNVVLEITSNPAWYAVQALPYLMEFPHECAEQTFARYYANTLASSIANSNPRIREVFDKWSSSDALLSDLERNPELKSIIISETPWARDAMSETEQKKRIGLLFDLENMKRQRETIRAKLEEMQFYNGGFPWFKGSDYPNRYITQHIASGYGHLMKLNIVPADDPMKPMITRAIKFLDDEILNDYHRLLKDSKVMATNAKNSEERKDLETTFLTKQHVNSEHIQYLYMRSLYDVEQRDEVKQAMRYYLDQSAHYWMEFNLQTKSMIAMAHNRIGNIQLSRTIMQSITENSITSEQLGMYWKENTGGWYWNEAPIETQALLIEAFSEIETPGEDSGVKEKVIDEMRIWLLRNKQTNQWRTTKATTEAIYALLLNGREWLTLDDQVEVSVGNEKITTDAKAPEVGTGYFKTSWKREQITPALGNVQMIKKGTGIAWGGLYWQYFEDLDKITTAETPLKLTRKVFVVEYTDRGERLISVDTVDLKIGDLLRVRIELVSDRAMEFLHMKDLRASGLEPVDVLSGYKWQEGLGYYQSTRDASTNFFFDRMEKGVYVFEYELRVNNRGNFSNGITTIQSMYAPEFSSHSEGLRIHVK